MKDFWARSAAARSSLLSFLAKHDDLHLLTGMKGNVGDHLIWSGTDDLLAHGRLPVTRVDLAQVLSQDRSHSTLLVPGSGAFDRRWHEWLPATVIAASRAFGKIVILPSSFDPRVAVVEECLSLPNVLAFAREEGSYRAIRRYGQAGLSLDCAVYCRAFSPEVQGELPQVDDGLLLALREDQGSLLPGLGLRPDPRLNRDISLSCASLEEWLAAIAAVGHVVTDRLHVAVAAVLLGRRLTYVDPYDSKISTYWKYTFGDQFDALATQSSTAWLLARGLVVGAGSGAREARGPAPLGRAKTPRKGKAEPGAMANDTTSARSSSGGTGGRPEMRICAVCCAMGSPELLVASMSHLVGNGLGDFYLYDHGSDPGLASILSRSAGLEGARVTVLRKETSPFFQKAMVGVLTELARLDGFEGVLAFDADEFWCSTVPGRTVAEQMSMELREGVVAARVPVANYVQHRDVRVFHAESLETCRYLVVPHEERSLPERELVEAGMPFVAMPFPSKVVARLRREVRFTEGQHGVTAPAEAGVQVEADGLVVRHLSLPAREELAGKREHGRRRAAAAAGPDLGWQLTRLAGMTDVELDAYWANNSWRRETDGRVLVGDYSSLVEDTGLADIGARLHAATQQAAPGSHAAPAGATIRPVDPGKLERVLEAVLDDCGRYDHLLQERLELLAVRQADIEVLRGRIGELEDEVTGARDEAERATNELGRVTGELTASAQARDSAEAAVRAVESSTSWRVTAPLRAIARMARRAR